MTDIFVYGTLQYPEVLRALIGRVPDLTPATLTGYRRYCVSQQVFPAIIPGEADDSVKGYTLYGLNAHEVKVMDEFESEEYVKTAGAVLNAETDRLESVLYYVWHPSLESQLERRSWSPEAFREQHLQAYTKMCIEFAAELRSRTQW
ncbi:hypothetical protein ACKKBG_A18350 [Auxenochlorella protothecoides x Auxenochlorella symbiontica]